VSSFLTAYTVRDNYIETEGQRTEGKLLFELMDENKEFYDELKNFDDKTIVVYPIFTAIAYDEPGFYNYFRGECDTSCLTLPIKFILRAEIGANSAQILKLFDYQFISDIDIDKNPNILKNFDKVILLHNEYVTRTEFDAITSHPNVVYFYPNALYAEVGVNYEENTINLIRGHNYPSEEIRNGFDWEFDNSELEYDIDCLDMQFYRIDNGWMLNCYPELRIYEFESILKTLKGL